MQKLVNNPQVNYDISMDPRWKRTFEIQLHFEEAYKKSESLLYKKQEEINKLMKKDQYYNSYDDYCGQYLTIQKELETVKLELVK